MVVALALLVILFVSRGERPEPEPPKVDTAKPMPVPAANNQAEAEIVSFLATLQEQGRLIDFLMDDITTYDDAQVGAEMSAGGSNLVDQELTNFDREIVHL